MTKKVAMGRDEAVKQAILTPERLAEIEARAKKATPGPMQILHGPGDLNECYWLDSLFSVQP